MYCAVWVEEGFCKETGNDVYCLICCVFHVCVCVCLWCVLYYIQEEGWSLRVIYGSLARGFPS